MATERKHAWKPRAENDLIGHEVPRVDGYLKSTGQAKYTADINTKKHSLCKAASLSKVEQPRLNILILLLPKK